MALSHLTCWQEKLLHIKKIRLSLPPSPRSPLWGCSLSSCHEYATIKSRKKLNMTLIWHTNFKHITQSEAIPSGAGCVAARAGVGKMEEGREGENLLVLQTMAAWISWAQSGAHQEHPEYSELLSLKCWQRRRRCKTHRRSQSKVRKKKKTNKQQQEKRYQPLPRPVQLPTR